MGFCDIDDGLDRIVVLVFGHADDRRRHRSAIGTLVAMIRAAVLAEFPGEISTAENPILRELSRIRISETTQIAETGF
jgi:hypothetical protein